MSPDHWQAIWSRRGPAARLLWPVSLAYAMLGALRRRFYTAGLFPIQRLNVPVVVVGNVVVGGAGKTPTVIALVEHLRTTGWRPGVVSRGYGREGDDVLEVEDGTPAHLAGDEPALIRQRTGVPVCVARRRVKAARALLAAHPEVNLIVCDDGLQHLELGRDIAIAVFDERGVGNGWQLPAGLLREPWPPAASHPGRPDLLLVQRRSERTTVSLPPCTVPTFEALRRLSSQAVNPEGQRIRLAELAERKLSAVAGIARPQTFFDMLDQMGLKITRRWALDDHAGVAEYASLKLLPGDTVICTEKDAVKLFPVLPAGVQAWAVPLELIAAPSFWSTFDALLAQRTPHRRPPPPVSSVHGNQTA